MPSNAAFPAGDTIGSVIERVKRSSIKLSQARSYGTSPTIVALMAFYGLIAWSPIVITPGRGGLLFLFLLSGLIVSTIVRGRGLSLYVTLLMAAILISAGLAALYWTAFAPYVGVIWVVLAVLFWSTTTDRERAIFVDLATIWIVLLLIGAYIAFISVQMGFQPVGSFSNLDGRTNFVFWGTFSNTYFGRFMRPSGIYDEPGAFSFLICVVVAMRFFLKKRSDVNLLILVFGLITFSLAHLIFLLIYLLASLNSVRTWFNLVVVASLFVLVLAQLGALDDLHELADRAKLVEVKNLRVGAQVVSGDNRSEYLLRSIEMINEPSYSWLFGYDVACVASVDCNGLSKRNCCQPLLLLSFRGIVQSWFYYACLVVLLASPMFLGRQGFVALGVGLLLMQRPSVFELGYAMLVVLVVGLVISKGYAGDRQR